MVFLVVSGCVIDPNGRRGLDNKISGRGSYRGSFYEVKKEDTLYLIAYIASKEVTEIARYNNLSPPYTLVVGQRLNLWQPRYIAPQFGGTGAGIQPTYSSMNVMSTPPDSSSGFYQAAPQEVATQKKVANASPPTADSKIAEWQWPTEGRVIESFSESEGGNNGLDIMGQRGQSIVAAAGGKVVYSGDALRGYGNLIIIEHNKAFISAYAHNDKLEVSEGQKVKIGEKIATMGSSGADGIKLHFEIRHQGKPVDPEKYLP